MARKEGGYKWERKGKYGELLKNEAEKKGVRIVRAKLIPFSDSTE